MLLLNKYKLPFVFYPFQIMIKSFQFLLLVLLGTSAFAQSGTTDLSFGANGKVTTGFGRSETYGNTVAVQSDGKILCAGTAYMADTRGEFMGDTYNAVIYRYNADGSPDASFGTNGLVINKIPNSSNETRLYSGVYFIKVLEDGGFLTYGLRGVNSLAGNVLLCRYHANGSLDVSFGNNGYVDLSGSPLTAATPIVIQEDNKIVVLSAQMNSSNNTMQFRVERLTVDGALDDSFATSGTAITDFGFQQNSPIALALQSDGKILASGNSGNGRNLIARYNTNGSLDNSLDGDGRVVTLFGQANNNLLVTVLPSGKIQLVGLTITAAGTHFSISQYNSNGSLDNTFDGDGRTLSLFNANEDSYFPSSAARQLDGKYVVTTTTVDVLNFINLENIVVRRYNADGTVDATFGTNGKVSTDLMEDSQTSKAVAVQDDGKVLLAGFSGFWNFNVLRYTATGELDTNFNDDGLITEKVESSNDNGRIVLHQNDGKILLIGHQNYNIINTIGSSDIAMARYLEDGSLDSSFGVNGKNVSVFGQKVNNVRKAALQPDGKILVLNVYYTTFPATNGMEVIRFNTDGSVDTSFGTGGAIQISSTSFSSLAAIKVTEDGSFFVANVGLNPLDNSEPFTMYLTSFHSDGSVNVNFGNGGTRPLEGVFFEGADPDIAIQTDGKIVLSAYAQGTNGGFAGTKLFRFNMDGTLDPEFENEVLNVNAGPLPYLLFLEPDGKIIIAGANEEVNGLYSFKNFITARYNSNGNLDTSYGIDGITKTFLGDITSSLYSVVKSVIRQSDGKFLVGLTRYEQFPATPFFDQRDFAVYRFTAQGAYDSTFGSSGKVFTSFFTKYDEVFSIVLQDDHKVVLAGTTDNGTTRDFAITRLQNCINVSAEVSINLCAGDSYTVNNQTYTESGTYETTLTTDIGCDSVLTLNLTFDTLNAEIALNDNVFTSLNIPQNAQLQWLNCDADFAIITGETNPSFTAFSNGNYALETTSGNCRDTSNCVLFSSLGLHTISTNQLKVYPIPANETLILESEFSNSPIRILDAQGRLVFETTSNSKRLDIDLSELQNGLYFIQSKKTSQPFTIIHNR